MSHWTKVKTKLTNREHLKKALDRMGLDFSEGNHKITQYKTTEKAELKLDNAVGLSQQKDGTWAMVGDFWHSKNPKLKKYYSKTGLFNKELETNYAIEEAISNMEQHNHFCTDNAEAEVGADGVIRMTFESL
jgi:hypothetical protein